MYAQPGRFEREFVEIGELGSGEFGRVMKVRRQDGLPMSGTGGEISAVKKSKRFEGVRHRWVHTLTFALASPLFQLSDALEDGLHRRDFVGIPFFFFFALFLFLL
jgi:hypothetical protein